MIEQILEKRGPSLSSDLVNELKSAGLAPAAARKRVSRLRGGGVERLDGLRFPKREAFLYLEGQFGTEMFTDNLKKALIASNSAFALPLAALLSRGGAVPEAYLAAASGLPVNPARGHIPYSTVRQKLLNLGIVKRISLSDGDWVVLPETKDISNRHRACVLVEQTVLSVMKVWLGHVGWTSPGAVTFRDKAAPKYGQFEFDLVGPSYLSALVNNQNGTFKNGFIAADILLDRTISLADLRPFLNKWDILRMQNRAPRFQPAFIAEHFAPDALHFLRNRGCFVAIPDTIFGKEVGDLLRNLIQTMENAAAAVVTNPDIVWDLFSKLRKLEGAAFNLRGVFFEMLVAHLYRLRGYNIDIRKLIRVGTEATDIDVKATNNQKVVCCECKAYAPGTLVGLLDVENWEKRTLPLIKKWLDHCVQLPGKREFRFFSATDYTQDARQKLESMVRTHLKQPVKFVTGKEVLNRLRVEQQTSLVKSFQEQFGW